LIPLLTLLVTAGLVGLTPLAAQASSLNAQLQIKGTGSVYTPGDAGNHYVILPASPGSAVSFAAKVVNTGTTTAQFKLFGVGGGAGATYTYSVAGVAANGLIDTNDGYFTPAIPAGKSVAITVKITLDKATPPTFASAVVFVEDSDGTTELDAGTFIAVRKAPSAATGPDQIFVKNGSGSYVGGPDQNVGISGPALAVGGSTTFTAHIVNGGSEPDTIGVSIVDTCANYAIDVKAGSTEKTTAVLGGTYVTPTLAAGGHQDLTVKVTYLGPRPGNTCDYDTLQVEGSSQNFAADTDQGLFVNPAA
jgi:hypothetical protein